MKSFLPLLSLAMIFASCSTAYQSGQTPDDVYYSPDRAKDEYVRVEKDSDRRYRGQDAYRGQDYYSYEDDRYLRMRVRDRYRWDYLDYYYRDPLAYNYNPYYDQYRYHSYYNGYWNPRTYWNCYYNPYAPTVVVVNPRTPVYSKPRTYNLHVFDDPRNNQNPKNQGTRGRDYYTPGDQQRNTSRNIGNDLRGLFGNSESPSISKPSSSNSSSSSSERSSSSGSNGSSGSGGKAPVRKF